MLLRRTHAAGRHIGVLCEEVHRRDGQIGVKGILGVLSLAKKYGAAVVNDACEMALDAGPG